MYNDIEKQLNNLPKAKLGRVASLKIKFKIYLAILKNKFTESTLMFKQRTRFRQVITLAVLALFLLAATSTYAYASPTVARGGYLYPLKRGVEKIELGLAFSPLTKVKVYTKLAGRRIAEAEILSRREKAGGAVGFNLVNRALAQSESATASSTESNLSLTIQDAIFYLNQAEEAINQIKETTQLTEALNFVLKAQQDQTKALTIIAGTVGIDTNENVLDSVAVALDTVKEQQAEALAKLKKIKESAEEEADHSRASLTAAATSTEEENEEEYAASSTEEVENADKAEESLGELKSRIEELKNNLMNNGVDKEDAAKLFNRLGDKLEKTQAAIDQGKLEQVRGLLRATEALTNNGKHFLKAKERDNRDKDKSEPEKNYFNATGTNATSADFIGGSREERRSREQQKPGEENFREGQPEKQGQTGEERD